ncbi:cilia- and flagella-associated protein 57-like [Episyrphus balteatus]|uniref:cilia- and flagella-associated protein 57-like n=1 Tax=Episyrphus balteatus TaxID=286459 RepID=UPI002486CAC7|nr:cilia- and flagella-associated protein 57-like [Episyrphus balteatus]
MDESAKSILPVTIEPKHVYGIRSEVIGNIHFNLNQEVIYPVEGVLAFHDYVNNKQRFLRLPTNTTPTIIALNSTKILMAIVEINSTENREQTNIAIYDLVAFKKTQTYQLPQNARHKKITRISFTCDSKALVLLTEYPDEMLYMIFFDRLGTVVEGRAGNTNRRGMANHISCNPQNSDLVAVCGEGVMKLMVKSEKSFNFIGDIKPNFHATSIAWISAETFILGTKQGQLIVFSNTVKLKSYRAVEDEALDIAPESECESQTIHEIPTVIPNPLAKSKAVVCMTAFARGLAFAVFNQVFVFEKISKVRYERKTILDIPMTNYPEELYQITNLAINSKQDTVIVTPKHNQIYVGILIVPESLETKMLQFQTLGELIHIDEILDICMCSWRPIIVTSSKDKTIRVWNYHTGKVELVKRFPIEVTVIELYASGQYAAVGFIDKVKIMQIFMNDLNLIKMYNFPNSKDIKFSYFGHLMATAYENCIAITSVFNLETLKTLKGHSGMVLTLAWSRNDKTVISGGTDGALYQWDIETGARLQEIIQPGIEYHALCVPNDPDCFYAATNTGIIREIKSSKIVHEVKMPSNSPLQDIGLTRSDLVMFAATKGGHLYNVHMPLSDPAAGGTLTKFSFFDSAITKLRFSYDGTLLISSSASGTLVIWQLKNIEGKVAAIDQDLLKSQEVLIPRQELEDKIEHIKMLETRLKKQAAEFYKKQSQNEENEQQQMADTHKGYCEALTELNSKNQDIGVRHVEELTQITSQIDELNAEHKLTMENLSAQYSERMSMEYQKFAILRENMLQIRDSYETKLKKSEGCLRDTVEALELDFKKQLEERQELIRQLMKEMDDKKIEFTEYCRQVEVENDRKMIDCQIEYENKVKFERDETDKWQTQANVYQSKYDSVRKECDGLIDDVENLKEQHFKSKSVISELRDDISDLHRDVTDRENAINLKEKRIDEMILKNEELEKYKQVLNHKINELKAQIEPREMTIVEKRKQITEMEQELTGLQKNNIQLELQLKELRDKCISVNVELKQERTRAKSARLCVTDICTEIYQLSQKLNHTDEMKEGMKALFLKYSDDDILKKFSALGGQQHADFQKQRAHIEKIMLGCKQKMDEKASRGSSKKLLTDNRILKEEVEKLRQQDENMKIELKNLRILVDIFKKTKQGFQQSEEGLLKSENIQNYFEKRIINLKSDIEQLVKENEKCKKDIGMKRMMLNKTDL